MSADADPFLKDAQQLDAKLQERRKALPEEDKGLAYWESWCDTEGVDKVPTWSSLARYIADFVAPMEEAVRLQAQKDPTKTLLEGVKVFVEPVLRFRERATSSTTEQASTSTGISAKKSHKSMQTPKALVVNMSVQVTPTRRYFSTQTPLSRKGVDVGVQAVSTWNQKSTQTPASASIALSATSTFDEGLSHTTAIVVSADIEPPQPVQHQETPLQEEVEVLGFMSPIHQEQGPPKKRLFGVQDPKVQTTPSASGGASPSVASNTSTTFNASSTSSTSTKSGASNTVSISVTDIIRELLIACGSSSPSSPVALALLRQVRLPVDTTQLPSSSSDGSIEAVSNMKQDPIIDSPMLSSSPHASSSKEVEHGRDYPKPAEEDLYPMFKAEEFQLRTSKQVASPQAFPMSFKYDFSGDVNTVPQVLQEWRYGLKGKPSIQDLNVMLPGRWWDIADMDTFEARSLVVEEYVRLVLHDGRTNAEAIQALESLQGVTGINTLMDALRVERELAAGTRGPGKSEVEERERGGPSQKRVRLDPPLADETETEAMPITFPHRNFNSVDNIWTEWTDGWQGQPSIASWIKKHGKPWKEQSQPLDEKVVEHFQVKQRLVNIIKKAVSTGAVPSATEAIQAMEKARGDKTARQFSWSPALQTLKYAWNIDVKRERKGGNAVGTSKQK